MDFNQLPFKDNTFDTVISDPPWKINFFHRARPFFEGVRVCKIGGTIIYNATWIPTSKYVKLKEIVVRQDAPWCNISALCVFKKTRYEKNRLHVEQKSVKTSRENIHGIHKRSASSLMRGEKMTAALLLSRQRGVTHLQRTQAPLERDPGKVIRAGRKIFEGHP